MRSELRVGWAAGRGCVSGAGCVYPVFWVGAQSARVRAKGGGAVVECACAQRAGSSGEGVEGALRRRSRGKGK